MGAMLDAASLAATPTFAFTSRGLSILNWADSLAEPLQPDQFRLRLGPSRADRTIVAGLSTYPAAATAASGGASGQAMAPLRTSDRIIWHDRSAIAAVQVYGFAACEVPLVQPWCSRSYSSRSRPARAWVKP